MGLAKAQMMEDEERGVDFVQDLIDCAYLERPALGIAKLWIDQGDDALTHKQKFVLKQHVFGEFTTSECARCSGNIPWSEMLEAYDNGGYCGYCQHMKERMAEE